MKNRIKIELIVFIMVILSFTAIKLGEKFNEATAVETNITKPSLKVVHLSEEIYQQDTYFLPEEIDFRIKDKIIKDKVVWDKKAVTDTPGKYMYEGHTLKYNYCVNLILNIKENHYHRKMGYIRNIYINETHERIIEFDPVEFFEGEEALIKAIKDNEIEIDKYGGIKNLDYYIRNATYDKELYKMNKFSTFELMEREFDEEQKGGLNLVKVDFELMKKYVDNYNNSDDEEKLLFCIDLKNNEVISIIRQYLKYN